MVPPSAVSATPSTSSDSVAEPQLTAAIRSAPSIDALLALHARSGFHFNGRLLSQTINRMKRLLFDFFSKGEEEQAPDSPPPPFSLEDERFSALLDHLRLSLTLSQSPPRSFALLQNLSRILIACVDRSISAQRHIEREKPTASAAQVYRSSFALPPAASALLSQLLSALQRDEQPLEPRTAVRVLYTLDNLWRLQVVHDAFIPLLQRVVARLSQADVDVREFMSNLRLVELSNVALCLSNVSSLVGRLSTTELAGRIATAAHARLQTTEALPSRAPLARLLVFAAAFNMFRRWQFIEHVCTSLYSLTRTCSLLNVRIVSIALSQLSYYHEPLLLALASQVLALLRGGSRARAQSAAAHGSAVLQSYAMLRAPPSHPLVMALFVELGELACRAQQLLNAQLVNVLWSITAQGYHEPTVQQEVLAAWEECPPSVDEALLTKDYGRVHAEVTAEFGASAAALRSARVSAVRRMQARLTKVIERAVHVANRQSLDSAPLDSREWRRLGQVFAVFSQYSRLRADTRGLPAFSDALQSRLHSEVHKARQLPGSRAAFHDSVQSVLASLGLTLESVVSVRDSPFIRLLDSSAVGVRYPVPTAARGDGDTVLVIVELMGESDFALCRGRVVHRRGPSEVVRRWLTADFIPCIEIRSRHWWKLVLSGQSDAQRWLSEQFEQAVRAQQRPSHTRTYAPSQPLQTASVDITAQPTTSQQLLTNK